MNIKTWILASLFFLVAGSARAQTFPVSGGETQVGISDAFVPSGFDDQTELYVILNGVLPTDCYEWSRFSVTNVNGNVHEIRVFASVLDGACVMKLKRFSREIHLGLLAPGYHRIRFMNPDHTYFEKLITVGQAVAN